MEETGDLVEVVGLESVKEGKCERKVLAWDDGRTLSERKSEMEYDKSLD